MPNYGVIDLGSNSIRLCVYEVKNDTQSSYTKKDFRSLLNNKVLAGLSAHVEEGIFTKGGINHALNVLRGHQKRLKYFNCVRTDLFATAVLRNCTNLNEVMRAIEEETGLPVTLLSEYDEAHLGFVGASSECAIDEGTLIDIGGGSTELTRIHGRQDSSHISLAQGSLSSYATYVQSILPTAPEKALIEEKIEEKLARVSDSTLYRHPHFYGIGGTFRAAGKVYAELFSPGERPSVISRTHLTKILAAAEEDPNTFAHLALKAAPDRIHTVLPGALIASTLMERFKAEDLTICKSGVREGYLIERMLL